MAKNVLKVEIEGIVELVVRYVDEDSGVTTSTWVKINSFRVPVAVPMEEVKSQRYPGDSVLAWAQSHWDDFLPETILAQVTPDVQVPGEVRWMCVTAAYNAKTGRALALASDGWTVGSKNRKKAKKTKKTRKAAASVKAKPPSSPPSVLEQASEGTKDMMAEVVEKALQ